jgi:type IV pilus assembly protein PilQ
MTRSGSGRLTCCLFAAGLLCLLWFGGGVDPLLAQRGLDVAPTSLTAQQGLDVAPMSGDTTLPPKPEYKGEAISLKLVDVSLVDFFRTISELTGLNILIDPDVKGTITINVEEVPWDLLFETVLRSHGLEKSIDGNLVRIATKKTLQTEEKANLDLKKAAFEALDTATVTQRLNYAQVDTMAKSIEKQLTRRGRIDTDARTNTLVITDVRPSAERIVNLIKSLDVPQPQVEIESRIIETTTNFSRRLGVDLGLAFGDQGRGDKDYYDKINTDRPEEDRNRGFIGSNTGATGADTGYINMTLGKLMDTLRLDAILDAGQSTGDLRILSRPKVTVQNGYEATVVQGAKIPVPMIRNYQVTVQMIEAALRLSVTPQITQEGTIILNMLLANDVPDFTRTVQGVPLILISGSKSVVLLPDGGTTVVGGIFVEQDRNQEEKVPGLGDVPVVGHLFKRNVKARETREILFFITAKIRS